MYKDELKKSIQRPGAIPSTVTTIMHYRILQCIRACICAESATFPTTATVFSGNQLTAREEREISVGLEQSVEFTRISEHVKLKRRE